LLYQFVLNITNFIVIIYCAASRVGWCSVTYTTLFCCACWAHCDALFIIGLSAFFNPKPFERIRMAFTFDILGLGCGVGSTLVSDGSIE
jgi:hypothetical protein